MQNYTLALFRKDDSRFQLRISDANNQMLVPEGFIEQTEIDVLLAATAKKYSVTAADLIQRGKDLFNWVDQHSDGWLRSVRQTPDHMALTIDITEAKLRHLPWELLHDGKNYLCANPLHLFTPLRLVEKSKTSHWQAEKRALSVLFMASSPQDVEPVLSFEAEEAGILDATAQKPIELQVEESGSLEGLEARLYEYEKAPDIIHISGHADVKEGQPVFLLEDDVGSLAVVTPEDFSRTLLEADQYPILAFLSGCRTGQSDQDGDGLSFSEQVVKAGVPVVLGWGLPVGDITASKAAAALYEKLAKGFDIAQAIAFARQQLQESGSVYWHLLRAYVSPSPLNALIKRGPVPVRKHYTAQQFLDAGGRVPVCSRNDFVGRRRLLQRCLRHLRAWPGDDKYAEGILLYGMGGLGKSSAAARLVDRLRKTHEPVVCYGGLDETVLIGALGRSLSPQASGLLNNADMTLEERLRVLFGPESAAYRDKSLLLVIDDFEQNIPLSERKKAKPLYNPESLNTLNAVLQAIRNSQSDTRVIVTSRFDVPVSAPCKLSKQSLETLQAVDLTKKLDKLAGLQLDEKLPESDQALRLKARELGAGNPRLLEWLNDVLQNQPEGVADLLVKLEQREAEFREAVLIAELVDSQTSAVRHTLACAALYEIPMPLAAIQAVTDDKQDTQKNLSTAASVGLIEMTGNVGDQQYFVSSLLDKALADVMLVPERKSLCGSAAQFLYETLEQHSESMAMETLRLAIAAEDQALAVKVGGRLTSTMLDSDRHREAEALCLEVLALGEDYRVLTALARAEHRLGRTETREHFERALSLYPEVDLQDEAAKEVLREKSVTLFNYAGLLIQQGETHQALMIVKEKVLPIFEQLGDVRSKAVTRVRSRTS